MKLLEKSGLAFALLLLLAFPLGGQAQLAVTTATLSGSVTDPSGAVVPQAAVKLNSTQTGISRTYVTDAGGRYSFTQLPPATYTLSVQANGFESYRQNGIVLDAAQTATQNVALTMGVAS